MRHGKYPFVVAFLAPPVALYAIYVISPYLQAFYISLTRWSGFSANVTYVGLANYRRLLGDGEFWNALLHNLLLLVLLPVVTILLGLFFASMLNVGGRSGPGAVSGVFGSRLYRVVYFFPQVLAVMVWMNVGFYIVLFSAGMQSIPRDIYEAALLDGASRFTTFWRITVPLLWDSIQVAWIYLAIIALDAFALVQIMLGNAGGPSRSGDVIGLDLYRTAFNNFNFGYASAMGVALFFLTLTIAVLSMRVTRRERIEF